MPFIILVLIAVIGVLIYLLYTNNRSSQYSSRSGGNYPEETWNTQLFDRGFFVTKISHLRKAGFFKDYKDYSDDQLADHLIDLEEKAKGRFYGEYYNELNHFGEISLVELDPTKSYAMDLECDVGNGNSVYAEVIKELARLSDGYFNPTMIKEQWESDTGPIHVSFISNGQKIYFSPEYNDDWLSEEVFQIVNTEMAKSGNMQFFIYGGYDGLGTDQNIHIARFTPEELTIANRLLHGKFLKL